MKKNERQMFLDNLRNNKSITLPKTVRSLPNLIRFQNQGNALSLDQIYQGTTSKNVEELDIEFWNNFKEYLKKTYRKSSIKMSITVCKTILPCYYRRKCARSSCNIL